MIFVSSHAVQSGRATFSRLIQTLAQVIADHSGNGIDSSRARLGGEFARILRVDVSELTVASFEK